MTMSGIILAAHIVIFLFLQKRKDSLGANIRAVFYIYLIVMLSYMVNNVIWNFGDPGIWLEKFLHVYTNIYDNVAAILTAIFIRAVIGRMKDV